ncbi:MAG: hypothetical protein ACLTBR_03440 [Anaerostipes sp.]|uniref:hypothetical protein n=1 Tax=Anaerostipes sp. TaxID=1872530 RepID=UPI003995818B
MHKNKIKNPKFIDNAMVNLCEDAGKNEVAVNYETVSNYESIQNSENSIDYEAWTEFFSYYRYYIDEFAIDILGIELYFFQRVILRAMARSQFSVLIACRGIGKSWIVAVFYICMSILYPGCHCGIASGNGQQAKNVIIQKIKGELSKNKNVAAEISGKIHTTGDDCYVEFNGGSDIRAIVLAQDRGGDGARSWRFNYLLCDEARLVRENLIEEILIPMTKTKRDNARRWKKREKGKVIFISSAHLKTSGLYKRFKFHYDQMVSGNKSYLAMCFPYQVGVEAGLMDMDDIEQELHKPTMTKDRFAYEYEGIFVGSSGESYYPYDLTVPCRTLVNCELAQPKNCSSIYIVTHDVAVSDARGSDNACTHVIKLKMRPNGIYTKSIVYTKVMNGVSIKKQRDFLRELIHIKFPNTKKLVIDERGVGVGLPSMFYESWEYTDPVSNITVEYPPIIKDNDEEGFELENAIPLIRPIQATNEFHIKYYPYMKACFEDRTLQLLTPSEDSDILYKDNKISAEENAQHVEHDTLQSELSNIKQDYSEKGNIQYLRIVKGKKRDRATSLCYGLSVVCEMEDENRKNLYKREESDLNLLSQYTYI